jgi:hypothetical protein
MSHNRNDFARAQQVRRCARRRVRWHPPTGDSHSRTSYGTVRFNLAGASNRTAQPQNPASIRRGLRPDTAVDIYGGSKAMACKSLAIAYPQPRHTRRSASHRVRPALRRGSELTGAFPADVDAANAVKRVCAGHRPATAKPDDRQNRGSLDTPTGYIKRAPDRRFRRSEALSRTRWQVKDSNLRSSRDGFTVHSHWPLGQPAVVRMEG